MNSKEHIMEVGFELFQQKGYDNVSIEDICNTLQITPATLYKYIRTKEEILQYHFIQIQNQLETVIQKQEANLDLLWTIFLVPIQKNMEIQPNLYSKYIILHFHGQPLSSYYAQTIQQAAIQSIENEQKAGTIQNLAPAKTLYYACRNISGNYAIQWCIQKGNFDLIQTIQQALQTILMIKES